MHWIIGDILRIKQKLPDDVRLDVAVPILPPPRQVKTVTYLVDTDDSLDRVARGVEILRWAMKHKVHHLRVDNKELAEFLQSFPGCGGISISFDTRVVPPAPFIDPTMPEWWPGPNYIR